MFGFCECSRVSSELRCLLHDPRCCIYTWLKSLTLKSLRWRAWSANRATLQCIMMCHQKIPQRSIANLSVYHCPWPPFRAVQTTLALGGSPVVPQRSKRDKLAPRHSAEGYPSQLLEGRHTLKPWTGPATPTSPGKLQPYPEALCKHVERRDPSLYSNSTFPLQGRSNPQDIWHCSQKHVRLKLEPLILEWGVSMDSLRILCYGLQKRNVRIELTFLELLFFFFF